MDAKTVINRAKRMGKILLGRDDEPPPSPEDVKTAFTARMEEAERILEQMQTELAKATRIKGEYFGLIEKMEVQRDEWRELYHQQSRNHHNAQVLLEGYLQQAREWLRKTILILNEYRTERGESLIQKPGDLDALAAPVGTAAEYKRTIEALTAGAAPLLDAKLERDKLDQEHEAHWAAMCACGHPRSGHATEDRNCVFEEGCSCEKFEVAT